MSKQNEIQNRMRQLAEKYPERVEKLANALIQDANNMEQLEAMSNEQIADLLLKHVWADLDIWTWKAAVVEAAFDRLKGLHK